MDFIKATEGKKTYAVAAAFAFVSFAKVMGWITADVALSLEQALLATGAVTLRMAIGNGNSQPVNASRPISPATPALPQKDWTMTLIVAIAAALAGSKYEGSKPPPDPIILEIERPADEQPATITKPQANPPTLDKRLLIDPPLRPTQAAYHFAQLAQPRLSGPSEVRPGELIEIVSDAPDDAAVLWDAVEPLDLGFRTYNSDRVLVCAAGCKGGRIAVTCITIQLVSGKIKATKLRHVVSVVSPTPINPPTVSLQADPDKIYVGGTVKLSWQSSSADAVKLNGVPVDLSGEQIVSPDKSTKYEATAYGGDLVATAQRLVTVTDIPPPSPASSLVVIVYESSVMQVPLQVHKARFNLESLGYQVRVIDQDVTTGINTVPKHVTTAIAAAKNVGLPALVVTTATQVLKAVKLPATAESIEKVVLP